MQLFSGNTAARREYIANELIKIVDVRVLILLVNSNCMNDIANTYRQKHIDYFISEMENYDDEEIETIEINNNKYEVITRKVNNSFTKEQLKKLLYQYAIEELKFNY